LEKLDLFVRTTQKTFRRGPENSQKKDPQHPPYKPLQYDLSRQSFLCKRGERRTPNISNLTKKDPDIHITNPGAHTTTKKKKATFRQSDLSIRAKPTEAKGAKPESGHLGVTIGVELSRGGMTINTQQNRS